MLGPAMRCWVEAGLCGQDRPARKRAIQVAAALQFSARIEFVRVEHEPTRSVTVAVQVSFSPPSSQSLPTPADPYAGFALRDPRCQGNSPPHAQWKVSDETSVTYVQK